MAELVFIDAHVESEQDGRATGEPTEAEALDAYSSGSPPSRSASRPRWPTSASLGACAAGACARRRLGVVLSPDGFLITSAHVVGGARPRARVVRRRPRPRRSRSSVATRCPISRSCGRRRRSRPGGVRRRRRAARRPARGRDRQPATASRARSPRASSARSAARCRAVGLGGASSTTSSRPTPR